uniref:Reverse transcriptase domain-containing protein n=1 Tax=Tanacetum cinerariifolium TaxID=118510 RepID=A0A699GQJ2_TANCI|nr:hypothetical protein [Tanacetum cinerariifolium]
MGNRHSKPNTLQGVPFKETNTEVLGKNVVELNELDIAESPEEVDRKDKVENKANDEPIRSTEGDLIGEQVRELVEMPTSQPIKFYLKHKINKELIDALVRNQRFNDSFLVIQSGKMECEAYHFLPIEPMCKGGLKYMDALVDQGSDVNVIPLSTYNRLTDEELVEIDIRLSLASQLHIYPLGIAEDVLVEMASFIYPLNFVILDIEEDRKRLYSMRRSPGVVRNFMLMTIG